jgi:hypothetical protein
MGDGTRAEKSNSLLIRPVQSYQSRITSFNRICECSLSKAVKICLLCGGPDKERLVVVVCNSSFGRRDSLPLADVAFAPHHVRMQVRTGTYRIAPHSRSLQG